MARQRPDHAAHRIDVERRIGEMERRFQECVEPADIGAEHEDPGHGHEQARNGERQQRQIVKQRGARRIGALHRPGDQAADDERQRRGAGGVDERVADEPQDAAARIGFGEIVERERAEAEAGVLGKGSEQEAGERNQHQPDADGDAQDQQSIRGPPAPSFSRQRTGRLIYGRHAKTPPDPRAAGAAQSGAGPVEGLSPHAGKSVSSIMADITI